MQGKQSNTQGKQSKSKSQENKHKTQPHEYDNTLKGLFDDEAPQIVANLLPGAVLMSEKNIEIDRSKLRVDLAYHILYDGEEAILNLELQTKAEANLHKRVLQYHAVLHAQHGKPVINVIIYPFETAVPTPPYEVRTAKECLSALYYKTICLWELDADPIVKNRVYCLYTVLPAMKGAKAELLKQALHEMVEHYPRHQLGHRLIRFHRIMRRATVMSEEEKQEVEEELYMYYGYDEFIDDNPVVLERIEKRSAEAAAKAAAKAKQEAILSLLSLRFPSLEARAQSVVQNCQDLQQLDTLFKQLVLAGDEQEARMLLKLPVADA